MTCWGSPRQTQVLEREDALGLSELCLSSSSVKQLAPLIFEMVFEPLTKIESLVSSKFFFGELSPDNKIVYFAFLLNWKEKGDFCQMQQIQILCHKKFAAERLRTYFNHLNFLVGK